MKKFWVFICLLLTVLLSSLSVPETEAFDSILGSRIHQEITRKALSFLKGSVVDGIVDGDDFWFDAKESQNAPVHFDSCNFYQGAAYINSQYQEVFKYLEAGDDKNAEASFGHLLHPSQDFYAHSNWVELHNGDTDQIFVPGVDAWPSLLPYSTQSGVVIVENTTAEMSVGLRREGKIVFVNDQPIGLITGAVGGFGECPPAIGMGHWDPKPTILVGEPGHEAEFPYDPHGFFDPDNFGTEYDGTGLNKDYKGRPGYDTAYKLAILQTKQEFCRLVNLYLQKDQVDAAAKLMVDWVDPTKMNDAFAGCGLKIDVDSTATELMNLITGKLDTTDTTKPLDLVFVIDTTSSMEDDIDEAKAHAQEIINQISASGLNWRLALVTYRDYPDGEHGELTDYQSRVEIGFSTDAGTISSAINALVVEGGGDGPESVYSGLMDAMSLDWRHGAQKVIVLLGDAPPQDPEPHTGYTQRDVLVKAFTLDPVNMYPILISDDPYARSAFAALADGSSGRIFSAATAQDVVPILLSTIETATGDTHLTVGGYARVYTTNGDTLNLRTGTNTSTTIMEKMASGTVVKIISGPEFVYPYIWWSVQSPDGTTGYSVEAADGVVTLVNIPASEIGSLVTDKCIGVTSETVDIHQNPNTGSKTIGSMSESTEVMSRHPTDKFTWFELRSGGWVRGDAVALTGNCTSIANK